MVTLEPVEATKTTVSEEHESRDGGCGFPCTALGDALPPSVEATNLSSTPAISIRPRSAECETEGVEFREGARKLYSTVLQKRTGRIVGD